MKKIVFTLLLAALIMTPVIGSFTKEMGHYIVYKPVIVKEETSFILETLTIYNPTTSQCDRTPLVTASNAKIDTDKLYKQELRWIALSRNLLKRWNGAFCYGDTVLVSAGDEAIDGLWIIQDNLNKRYKDRGDLLFDRRVRKLGKWNNVKITKL